jgi:hypothetical protein
MFRVFNVGSVTWVPESLVLALPSRSKGFSFQEAMSDIRVASTGDNAIRIAGTFSPGQHDIAYRFQVPNDGDSAAQFRVPLPPHVADVRVFAQSAPGMVLHVDGFEPAEPTVDGNGQKLLLAERRMTSGEAQLPDLLIQLSGLPTPGPGRWISVALAALLGVVGLVAARKSPEEPKRLANEDAARARELLIRELVTLERARAAKQIGPATYDSTRRQLLAALARLQAPAALQGSMAEQAARVRTPAASAS